MGIMQTYVDFVKLYWYVFVCNNKVYPSGTSKSYQMKFW